MSQRKQGIQYIFFMPYNENGIPDAIPLQVAAPPDALCPAGHHCSAGARSGTACETGSYQPNQGQTSCIDCPAGFFCPRNTSQLTGRECSKGFTCAKKVRSQCGQGTYNMLLGQASRTACVPCDPGHFCQSPELAPQKCDKGFFCLRSATTARPDQSASAGKCRPGYFCVQGTANPRSAKFHLSSLSSCGCSQTAILLLFAGLACPVPTTPKMVENRQLRASFAKAVIIALTLQPNVS